MTEAFDTITRRFTIYMERREGEASIKATIAAKSHQDAREQMQHWFPQYEVISVTLENKPCKNNILS